MSINVKYKKEKILLLEKIVKKIVNKILNKGMQSFKLFLQENKIDKLKINF